MLAQVLSVRVGYAQLSTLSPRRQDVYKYREDTPDVRSSIATSLITLQSYS